MNDQQTSISVMIAEKDPVFRRELRRSLECECGFHILADVSDAENAVQQTRLLKPDVLLLDYSLVSDVDTGTIGLFEDSLNPVRVVAMLTTLEKASIIEAFNLGVHGVVLKTSQPGVFFRSIRGVATGSYWLGGEGLGLLVEGLRDSLGRAERRRPREDFGLTRREMEIIAKIVSGRSNKEVGEVFSISERTVKHHLTNIFNKLGVSNRLQLALFAVNHQLMAGRVPSLVLPHSQLNGEA